MRADNLLDAIGQIDDDVILDAKNHTGVEKSSHRKKKALRLTAVLAAALAICVFAALPVAAVNVPEVNRALYNVFPGIAMGLRPVQQSCECDGIRMEVISAAIDGDHANIYVSMRDMTGDRLDETVDLFDSYCIDRAFDSWGGCEKVGFDEETGAATFLITMGKMNGGDLTGGKVTFSVGRLLTGKKTFDVVPINVSLTGNSEPMLEPVGGVCVTAVKYKDDGLHVAVRYSDILHTDNHGWLWLETSGGETVDAENMYGSDIDENGDSVYDYVFAVSPEEAESMTLHGEFTTCDTLITGDWSVTFNIE